jgi:hypothetical protein
MIKYTPVVLVLLASISTSMAQNCCAPSVPQQGILGETVSLPHVLDIGLHYQYLRSYEMFEGNTSVLDPKNTLSEWHQPMLTLSYGIVRSLSAAAVIPYFVKRKRAGSFHRTAGIGDLTVLVRYSPISRSFVRYTEITLGFGVKIPAGATDRRESGFKLPMELQPGSGSWDYNFSASFFRGFEPVDLIASVNYIMTTPDEGYEFGNSLAGLITANFHIHERLEASVGFSGISKGRDTQRAEKLRSTGRDQTWVVPGMRAVIVPQLIDLQVFLEYPMYQRFNGQQLASEYNVRVSTTVSIPLSSSDEE